MAGDNASPRPTENDREIEQQVLAARAWLRGYVETHRRVPNRAYIEAGTETDRHARLSLAQLLVDGNAPRDVLELLANCITPDYQQQDGTALPIGESITPSDNPLRILPAESPRRLDFSFRTGSRKRGAPNKRDPYRDGAILQLVMKLVMDGKTKTSAFETVGKDIGLSAEAVRGVWKKYATFVKFWENDIKENG